MATILAKDSANAFIKPKRLPSGISVVKVVKVVPISVDGVPTVKMEVLHMGREVYTIRADASESFVRIF